MPAALHSAGLQKGTWKMPWGKWCMQAWIPGGRKYGGYMWRGQEEKQLREEKTRLGKLVAELTLV